MFALHTIRSRFSPARLAKAAYLLILAAIVLLLLTPNSTRGQFRGLPAVHPFPGIPFTAVVPNFSGSVSGPFSGNFHAGFSTMPFTVLSIPYIPQTVGLPGPPLQFPLSNLMFDSTGGLLALSSGFGFGGLGMLGFGGLGGFNGITGLGGIGGIGRVGGIGSIGLNGRVGFGGGAMGFAGKGIGGFNGRKPL